MSEYDINKFKHIYKVRVRNFEVDSQGVLHNAIYLEYAETARIEYGRNLGFLLIPGGQLSNKIFVMVRRNEINYYAPVMIDELIDVYSRISYIKNSSFSFEHILLNSDTGKLYCDEKSILVNLNPVTLRPERVNDKFRETVRNYEGDNLKLEG